MWRRQANVFVMRDGDMPVVNTLVVPGLNTLKEGLGRFVFFLSLLPNRFCRLCRADAGVKTA